MKLVEGFDSNYRYVLVAARRARHYRSGGDPDSRKRSDRPQNAIAGRLLLLWPSHARQAHRQRHIHLQLGERPIAMERRNSMGALRHWPVMLRCSNGHEGSHANAD